MSCVNLNNSHSRKLASSVLVLLINVLVKIDAAQLSFGIEHDMSKPTYGLQGPSSSSITYDEKNGLNMKGTINDILGPPIKIANGFSNMLAGSNMAGIGSSLKTGGAVIGLDAKLLEAAGGANLLKGGLLMGGAAAKTGLATKLGGLPGKKISSIIEVPIKVVAMKDLAAGKGMMTLGKLKEAEAMAAKAKGASMIKDGMALKTQGMNQVVQGATEGMNNIGNMVQQTAGNAATAVKLLPIIFDLPMGQQQQQQQEQQVEQSEKTSQAHSAQQSVPGSLSGGSLFGGLSSLLPGLVANDPFLGGQQGNRSPFNLFGQNYPPHNSYAAVLNSTNPLTNLLMNPSLNPLLYPIMSGPLAQSIMGKQPGSIGSLLNSQPSNYNYNLFPGIKLSETSSSSFNQPQQQTEAQTQTNKV